MTEDEIFEHINDDVGLIRLLLKYKCEYKYICKDKSYNCDFSKSTCEAYTAFRFEKHIRDCEGDYD